MECTIARNNRKVFIHFFSGVRAPDLRFDEAKFDFPIFEFPAGFEFSGIMVMDCQQSIIRHFFVAKKIKKPAIWAHKNLIKKGPLWHV